MYVVNKLLGARASAEFAWFNGRFFIFIYV
jgi:hypothetical protein